MIEKILHLLNIRPDKNQRWILMSFFLSGLLITYVNPTITKAIVSELPAEWLAVQSLVGSISGLLLGIAWKGKIRKAAIKYFAILAISESVIGFVLALYLCFIQYNVWVFAITSLIYSTFITEFVLKCIMTFKSKLWIEKDREIYDNNVSIVEGIVCIIGFSCALLFLPSLKVSLFIWGLCCILDNIGWIIVYIKNKNILENIE